MGKNGFKMIIKDGSLDSIVRLKDTILFESWNAHGVLSKAFDIGPEFL